ncbi:MAG: SCO family protein [Anaerolineales bacterium]
MAARLRPLRFPDSSGAYAGTALNEPAAHFRLADQRGARLALSDFHGQVVALTFMDTQCQDTCPLTAIHLRKTYQALDAEAKSIIFLGINVNVAVNGIGEVAATTE